MRVLLNCLSIGVDLSALKKQSEVTFKLFIVVHLLALVTRIIGVGIAWWSFRNILAIGIPFEMIDFLLFFKQRILRLYRVLYALNCLNGYFNVRAEDITFRTDDFLRGGLFLWYFWKVLIVNFFIKIQNMILIKIFTCLIKRLDWSLLFALAILNCLLHLKLSIFCIMELLL